MSAAGAARGEALALYVTCGDLVVAFAIDEVVRVYLAEEVESAPLTSGALRAARLSDETLPAWDLAMLLGQRRPSTASAWLVLRHDDRGHRFSVAVDRSLAVRPLRLPLPLPLPAAMFTARRGAVRGAFPTDGLADALELAPAGLLLAAANLLDADDVTAAQRAAAAGKLSW